MSPASPFPAGTSVAWLPSRWYLRSTSDVPPLYFRSTSVPGLEVERRYYGGTWEVLRGYHGESGSLGCGGGAWAAESERRIDAFEAGRRTARNAGTVLSDIRKSLRK
jgi:hypothetical protein